MNTPHLIDAGLSWLLQTSWQAAILAIAIAIITRVFRKKLSPGAVSLLWMLVFLRLMMPALPGSPLSIFALLANDPQPIITRTPVFIIHTDISLPVQSVPLAPAAPPVEWAPRLLVGGWVLGTVWLMGMVLVQTIRFTRRLRRASRPAGESVRTLVEGCCNERSVRPPTVLLTDIVATPAIFGVMRPSMLIPPAILGQLSATELRSVILHELEHLRRRHLLGDWVFMFIKSVHWFNPAAWWAHRQIRAARELICDQAVLSSLDEANSRAYGQTMLAMASGLRPAPLGVPVAAFARDYKVLKQRIDAIASRRRYLAWLGVLLVVAISVIFLTKPQPVTAQEPTNPATRPAAQESVDALIKRAQQLIQEGRFDQALTPLKRALELDAGNEYARNVIALIQDRAAITGPLRNPRQGPATAPSDPTAVREFRPATERGTRAEDAVIADPLERTLPELRFDSIPFGDVIDFLRDVTSANIYVNWRALEAKGIDKTAKITARLREVKFAKALQVILDDVAGGAGTLTFVADQGVITISTVEDLKKMTPAPAAGGALRYPNDWPAGTGQWELHGNWTPATQPTTAPTGYNEVQRFMGAQAGPLLDRKLPEVRFDATPFADVVDFLRDISGANMHVNWRALEAVGVDQKAQVTARLRDVTFGKALETILRDVGGGQVQLGFTVDQGVITISTTDDLKPKGSVQNVGDLTAQAHDLVQLGKYSDALLIVDQILKQDPENDWARNTRPLIEDRALIEQQRAARQRFDQRRNNQPLIHDGLAIEQQNELQNPADPKNAQAQAAIDKVVPEVRLDAIPLSDAMDFMRDISGANIFVNWRALEASGIAKVTPVSAQLRDVKFGKALETILRDVSGGKVQLGYTIDEGVITISTAEDLQSDVVTNVYDVRDLVPLDKDVPEARRKQLVDAFVTLIKDTVVRETWRDNGGKYGSIRELSGQLIVTQTPDNQQMVARLIQQLRETRAVQISTETRLIELPKGLVAKIGIVDPQIGWMLVDDDQIAVLMRSEARALTAPRLTTFNGQNATISLSGDDQAVNIGVTSTISKDGKSTTSALTWLGPAGAPDADGKVVVGKQMVITLPDGAIALTKLNDASPDRERWLAIKTTIIRQREVARGQVPLFGTQPPPAQP